MEELKQQLEGLNVDSQTYFVISVIAKVPDHITNYDSSTDVDDSSDDDEETKCSESDFEFDINDKASFPFTTTKPRKTIKKEITVEELPESTTNYQMSTNEPSSATRFLKKLSDEGFEDKDKDKKSTIGVSIALNRMKSLSARKNRLLSTELQCETDSEIKFEKFGFFWQPTWYDNAGNKVAYSRVRTFYKEFKEIDPENAKIFREINEKDVAVPYQKLREYAKNHYKTKHLITEFRDKDPDSNIYLSLVDSDTYNFNEIYSAYLRILKDSPSPPTVMSTGFEYPEDVKQGKVYQIASQKDRAIKVITAKYSPLGVYYSEANSCILIEPGNDSLEESFMGQNNLESVCLLKNICANEERENLTFIFSDDKPIITSISDKAKVNNRHKSQISFANEFVQGVSPNDSDLEKLKQSPQLSFDAYSWCRNVLRFIEINEQENNAYQRCLKVLAKIRKGDANDNDLMDILKCLKNPDDYDLMVKLCNAINHYLNDNAIPCEDEGRLRNIMRKNEIELDQITEDKRKVLQQPHVLDLIEDGETINFRELIQLESEIIEYICCDEEIIENLQTRDIEFDRLFNSLKDNFSGFVEARKRISIINILYPDKRNNKFGCIII